MVGSNDPHHIAVGRSVEPEQGALPAEKATSAEERDVHVGAIMHSDVGRCQNPFGCCIDSRLDVEADWEASDTWAEDFAHLKRTSQDLGQASTDEIRGLLDAALSGDAKATQKLVGGITPTIHVRVARAMMRRRAQAKDRTPRQDLEDLVQDVFAALFTRNGRALRAWNPERGLSFLNFVGLLAEREVGMIMRTGKRNPWTEDPTLTDKLVALRGEHASHEDQVASRQVLERISERLRDRLSPPGRHHFQMLYVEDRPVKVVAEQTGTSTAALYAWRSRLGKLLRQLRAELTREGDERA